MSYEILEHTADEKFVARGETLEEAFSESVKAFSEVVGGLGGLTTHSIKIKSENLEALLFDFMDELIFLQDAHNVVVSHAENIEVERLGEVGEGFRLEADIWVDDIESSMAVMDVKAPTYSEMKVGREDDEWVLQIVLDI